MLHGQAQLPHADAHGRYDIDVLGLPENETEDALDDKLKIEARELGLDHVSQGSRQDGRRLSFWTLFSERPRRSESLSSRASQSTGFTSNCSEWSKERRTSINAIARSRASLPSREHDPFFSRGTPTPRNSFSSPPRTPSPSVFSLPLSSPHSSPRRHFRRIKGLSMLKLHKTESSTSLSQSCPHCPQETASQDRAIHKLPCGHRLCTKALRNIVEDVTNGGTITAPSCCNQPIPATIIEHAMGEDKATQHLGGVDGWYRRASVGEDMRQQHGIRSSRLSAVSQTIFEDPRASMAVSISFRSRKELDVLMDLAGYKDLLQKQEEQLQRFQTWMGTWRAEQESEWSRARQAQKARHDAEVEQLQDQQATDMLEAEDHQVKAEADLREIHAQERLSNATALKHMEAYCAGTFNSGEPHNRTVTEQERAELDKTRRIRDQMDSKHGSAINVLRGEQYKRMRARGLRYERELQDLWRRQRLEQQELDHDYGSRLRRTGDDAEERRLRLHARWELQARILLKKHEAQTTTQPRTADAACREGVEDQRRSLHGNGCHT